MESATSVAKLWHPSSAAIATTTVAFISIIQLDSSI
jgi:hypothetical protein